MGVLNRRLDKRAQETTRLSISPRPPVLHLIAMQGFVSLILHAHLPFVRHPEHEKVLEESWRFEAITETYLPLLQVFEGWRRDGLDTRLTLTISPTLCAMLLDPLLQERYLRHLDGLVALSQKEIHRTH